MVKTNFISWVDIVTDEIEKQQTKISPELLDLVRIFFKGILK